MNVGGDFTAAELQLQHYPVTGSGRIIRIIAGHSVNHGSDLIHKFAIICINTLADHNLSNYTLAAIKRLFGSHLWERQHIWKLHSPEGFGSSPSLQGTTCVTSSGWMCLPTFRLNERMATVLTAKLPTFPAPV